MALQSRLQNKLTVTVVFRVANSAKLPLNIDSIVRERIGHVQMKGYRGVEVESLANNINNLDTESIHFRQTRAQFGQIGTYVVAQSFIVREGLQTAENLRRLIPSFGCNSRTWVRLAGLQRRCSSKGRGCKSEQIIHVDADVYTKDGHHEPRRKNQRPGGLAEHSAPCCFL